VPKSNIFRQVKFTGLKMANGRLQPPFSPKSANTGPVGGRLEVLFGERAHGRRPPPLA